MPIVFVIALDWTPRAAVRAELLERRIQALGMEEADGPGRAIAAGNMPAAVVLEAVNPIATSTAIQELVRRVPTVLIASRTETIPLPPVAALLYRPVLIGEIVARVCELLQRGYAA
ncbi:MAG: hypothetical protein ACRD4C_15345 [Candidatus Acidiferrales bacterium]